MPRKKLREIKFKFDMTTMFLGDVLCRNGHEYLETGKTLRYRKSGRACVECCAARFRRQYLKNMEKFKTKAAAWAKENPVASKRIVARNLKKTMRRYKKDPAFRAKCNFESRQWYKANRAEVLARDAALLQSDPNYRARRLSSSRRSYAAHRTEILALNRWRYKNDSDYREKVNARKRKYRDRRNHATENDNENLQVPH